MAKKKSSKVEKYVMVCPECKSPDVFMDKSNPLQPAAGLPAMYICNKCEHSGYAFPEVALSKLNAFEEVSKGRTLSTMKKDDSLLVDTSYGNFEVRVLWKVVGPLVLLVGIFLLFKILMLGVVIVLMGLFMLYITYFKKRKLKG